MARESALVGFAEALRDYVSHPDYYRGAWCVRFRNGRKLCRNFSTASAWCKYFRRHYADGWTATVGRADRLPGFPRVI
jgi:hypothetical protein